MYKDIYQSVVHNTKVCETTYEASLNKYGI